MIYEIVNNSLSLLNAGRKKKEWLNINERHNHVTLQFETLFISYFPDKRKDDSCFLLIAVVPKWSHFSKKTPNYNIQIYKCLQNCRFGAHILFSNSEILPVSLLTMIWSCVANGSIFAFVLENLITFCYDYTRYIYCLCKYTQKSDHL